MSARLARIASFFVAPADTAAAFAPPRPRPPLVGVLAMLGDLQVAAGAAAGDLRREARAATVLVCLWRGAADAPLAAPAPGAPAAARLAAKLARRGAAVRACGALCVLELPAGAAEAAATARDAMAAADVPAVLALARRDPALDGLLAEADRLLLALDAPTDSALADVAEAALVPLGRPVDRVTVPRTFTARQLSRLGLGARRPAQPASGPPAHTGLAPRPTTWRP